MLKEIKSEIFLEKEIKFHDGLNVVLGDNLGSNSIGKSNLLMIIDFVFGGNTYIRHNIDVVEHLGHHKFFFTFEFNNELFYFCRDTEKTDVVFKCSQDYKILTSIKLEDYCKTLKEYYRLQSNNLTFRSAVSLFSRVWGKNNYNVARPLHNVSNEKNSETITRLIKLFNKYDEIDKEDKELKDLVQTKSLVNKAGNKELIPKITERVYKKNIKEIEKLKGEIEKLSQSIYSPTINISEIVSDKVIELEQQKRILINQKSYYKSRLIRIEKTMSNSANAKFDSLIEFFPNVNKERLEQIEKFHQDISSILNHELERAKKELSDKISALDEEIDEINQKLEEVLNPENKHNVFIENLIEISSKLRTLELENSYFEKLKKLTDDIDQKRKSLADKKEKIVKNISDTINAKLRELNTLLHDNQRTPPLLKLTTSDYEYQFLDNTGTGNAFKNLIIFDLAILSLTELPFIIHDSFLFKNIEKNVVENIISYYNSLDKQVFIAIDVINLYNKETQKILQNKKVIQLSKDKLLFIKDWRNSQK